MEEGDDCMLIFDHSAGDGSASARRNTRGAFQLMAIARLRAVSDAKLATQTSILNTVVDEIPAMVAIWDPDFRYRLVNKAFERWRGRTRRPASFSSIRMLPA